MLIKKGRLLQFCRFNSNFISAVGFDKQTASRDHAKRIAVVGDNVSFSYAQLNEKIGRYTALLFSKYGLQVCIRFL